MDGSLLLGGKQLNLNRAVRVWGIDLGTTNSTVTQVAWRPESRGIAKPEPTVLELDQPTPEGVFTSPLVPSVVAHLHDGGVWVGEGAKRLRARPQESGLVPEKTIFFDTKNEMGLKKSYYRAAEPFDRPRKIAGQVLRFLREGAESATGGAPDRVVVTVPASFQLSQRMDTIEAARLAGLDLKAYDLLDEPTAALLAYLETEGASNVFTAGAQSRVLVFDFGGGTCDVSIVDVTLFSKDCQLHAAMRGVSRYHRLGGGDLDAALVHEILIPALFEENCLKPGDFSWAEKKRGLEPQLLGTAEALKVGLCREIDRLKKFGKYVPGAVGVESKQPAVACVLGGKALTLSHPSLSAAQWEKILAPFLDSDALYARETEYRLTQSIFAPLQDALDCSHMKASDVDVVLLVGGSTLIPQVREAVAAYFSKARVVGFEDPMEVQLAVSRGAALHAFFLEATGQPFIQPVTGSTVALLTGKGEPMELVRAGSSIPYPKDMSFARLDSLAVPATGEHEMRMEVVSLPQRQVLLNEIWKMDGAAKRGEPITLEYRFGANGEFECGAYVTARPDQNFHRTVENPLVTVVNPHPVRLKIEAIEERLREQGGPTAADALLLQQLARLYAELGQHERALDFLKIGLRLRGRPDAEMLNLMGLYYADIKDQDRAEKAYLAANEVAPRWAGPMFNLALLRRSRGDVAGAIKALDVCLEKEPSSGPAKTLKAQCLQDLGKKSDAEAVRQEAATSFGPPSTQDDWELGWFEAWARSTGDAKAESSARKERARRSAKGTTIEDDALRPELRPQMEKR